MSATIQGLNIVSKIKFVTIISYWGVGIPVAWYLMFKKDMKLVGLWYGPTVACMLNFIYYEYIVNTVDWQDIANKMGEKLNAE